MLFARLFIICDTYAHRQYAHSIKFLQIHLIQNFQISSSISITIWSVTLFSQSINTIVYFLSTCYLQPRDLYYLYPVLSRIQSIVILYVLLHLENNRNDDYTTFNTIDRYL